MGEPVVLEEVRRELALHLLVQTLFWKLEVLVVPLLGQIQTFVRIWELARQPVGVLLVQVGSFLALRMILREQSY